MEVHKLNSRPPRIDEFNKGPRKVDLAEEFNMKVGDLVCFFFFFFFIIRFKFYMGLIRENKVSFYKLIPQKTKLSLKDAQWFVPENYGFTILEKGILESHSG